MDITIMSVITTSLLMSIIILAFCVFFGKRTILRRIGPKCMTGLLLAMLLRMFLPFEFPHAYSIYIEDVFTPFRYFLSSGLFYIGGFEWTVWRMVLCLWAVSVVILSSYRIKKYRKVRLLLDRMPKEGWDSFCKKYRITSRELKSTEGVQIVYCNKVSSPCLVGVKKRYFVLPELDYEEAQMRYIVLHELSHAKNRDIVQKMLMELLCTVFWWNPVFWHLKRELFRLVELRNDLLVTKDFSAKEKIEYMECLKNTAMQIGEKEDANEAAFNRSSFRLLKERLELLASGKPFSRGWQIVFSILVCTAMLVSSAVIFEPFSHYSEEEGVVVDESNTYLIKSEGQYDVYVYGEYVMTTGDLSPFDGINIYNNIEEAQKNEKKKYHPKEAERNE